MEKKSFFKGWKLPLLLVTPQLIISAVFFFYPSGQAIWNSLFLPDPFGLKTEFVGLDNFRFLLSDSYYLSSFKTTIIFSVAVTVSSMLIGLYLAALADRLIKGSGVYQTLLIWPYAIAPAIAGVLWLFLFNGNIGLVSWYLKGLGYEWNHNLDGDQAMFLVVLASAWGRISYNFLFFFCWTTSNTKKYFRGSCNRWSKFLEKIYVCCNTFTFTNYFFLIGCKYSLRFF